MDLFDQKNNNKSPAPSAPLAERVRPKSLDEFVGQQHLIAPGKVLRQAIESDRLVSMIFWGPPGVGKTTLARIIAGVTKSEFFAISAVTSGVKEVRKIIEQADFNRTKLGK
ncbi:AAA family ATPase, partial [candidate division KSB1 bacterium]|nr:AAA family ATPase [candidate division KSB1 bacterium]